MRIFALLSTVLAGLALTGCAGVFSVRPVGEQPLVLQVEEWEGTWTDSESYLELRVVDAASGRLEAAWIETSADGFELERVEVLVREAGGAVFGSAREKLETKDTEESGEERYAFFRLDRSEGKIVIWWPSVEAFKALVESGELPGRVSEDNDVELGPLTTEQLAILAADERAELWLWKEPGVLFRPSSQ